MGDVFSQIMVSCSASNDAKQLEFGKHVVH